MEDIYEKILYSYGLKLYATQRTRRGLICKTDMGFKELRKTNSDAETIEFENLVKKHLEKKGFKNTDLYLETTIGKPYHEGVDNNFVLSEYVNTVDIERENPENMKKTVIAMAQVHRLSQGLNVEGKDNLGNFPDVIKKRKAELIRTKKWINNQSKYSPLDLIVIKNFYYLLDRTNRAQELLNSRSYEMAVDLALERKNICHNNFKGDRIRAKEKEGSLYITGFEKSAYDCGVWDLADFIRRCIKDNNCTAREIDGIIESYNSVLPLEPYELDTLGAMILFPTKVFKICNACYNKRKVVVSEGVLEKLETAIAISEKEEKILRELRLIK